MILFKKTDYNTKVTSIENQIAGVTKNTKDNLADLAKLKAADTRLTADINTLDNKIPDISGLATKSSLTAYLQTATFISKITEVENKIKATDTKTNAIKSDLTRYAKKADVAIDITTIKNDYVTNASLTSPLNATEVTAIDNKAKKRE